MDLRVAAFTIMAVALLVSGRSMAQQPAPPGTDLAVFAARRHPQAVKVGDLIDRTVLQPVESRRVLGHVRQVVRLGDGQERIIMHTGGWFGFGGRLIAVPLDAMVLLGNELEILDLTPEQLHGFPTYDGIGTSPVDPGKFIRMGLAHPSH